MIYDPSWATSELDTPTIARLMPMRAMRWTGFSVTNASQGEARLTYIKLNRQAFCPPREGLGPRMMTLSTPARLTSALRKTKTAGTLPVQLKRSVLET